MPFSSPVHSIIIRQACIDPSSAPLGPARLRSAQPGSARPSQARRWLMGATDMSSSLHFGRAAAARLRGGCGARHNVATSHICRFQRPFNPLRHSFASACPRPLGDLFSGNVSTRPYRLSTAKNSPQDHLRRVLRLFGDFTFYVGTFFDFNT